MKGIKYRFRLKQLIHDFFNVIFPKIYSRLLEFSPSNIELEISDEKLMGWFELYLLKKEPYLLKTELGITSVGISLPIAAEIFRNIPPILLWNIEQLDSKERALLAHLAQGKNLRALPQYQGISAKTAHEFVNLPIEGFNYSSIRKKIIFAFLRSVVSSKELRDKICPFIFTSSYDFDCRIPDILETWRNIVMKFEEWSNQNSFSCDEKLDLILSYVRDCFKNKIELTLKGQTFDSFYQKAYQWELKNKMKEAKKVENFLIQWRILPMDHGLPILFLIGNILTNLMFSTLSVSLSMKGNWNMKVSKCLIVFLIIWKIVKLELVQFGQW